MLTSLREGPQQRPATPDEQRVLARWAGWGAVPQLFDEHLDDFAEQRAELKQLLTEQQYRAAARSTINAHYTDAALVKVIWEGLAQLGFTGGTVLEPGCGSGHFIGLAPDDARMVGVEREPISAAIAAALYPHADIHTASFADITAAEGSFDAAIGNVPFANITLHDPRHNSGKHSLHNHFIIKSLHLTRPGGMVAVLTSRYTMDARNPAARREMAQLADLVSAIRLPSGAHRRAAGTEVVTDLLILRRREPDRAPAEAAGWERVERTPLGDDGTTVEINRYFLDHPDHVLGELSLGRGRFGAEDLVVRGEITDLSERLATVLERVAADAVGRGLGMTPPPETPVESRPATTVSVVDPEAARFEGFLAARPDGSFTRRVGGTDQPYTPPAKQAEELRALLGLRDTAMALIKAEQATVDDTSEITGLRAELNRRYEAYREQYGAINRYTVRRQARQGWHVFRQWCEQHGYESMPADPAALRAYMQHLLRAGIGQDILSRHLDSITKAHTRAFDREVAKAATQLARHDSDPAEARRQLLEEHPPLDLLRRAHLPDLRMPEDSIRAAEEIIAQAPQKTSNLVDLDELGLRNEIINRPPQGGFGGDPFANYVRALEKFDPSTQTARKADILLRRVINPTPQRLGAETAEEALSICLDTHSRVDLAVIAQLLGLPGPQEARAALGELVYDDPDLGEPVWAPLYLSGNVRQKLARAELAAADNPAFEVNVAALRRVVPKDLGPEDIEVRLGSWIGPEYVQAFLRDILGDHSVTVESVAGMWAIDNKDRRKSVRVAATEIWGAGGLDAYELTEKLLVGTPIQVKKTIEVDGVEREVLDVEATENAQDKAVEIGNRFADWIWEDTRRAASVMRRYNELFNAEIPADFSGVELSLPGLSQAYELRPHQKEAVARIIYQPATGLVHDVGAGKTLEIIVGMMERRRRGLATKPMVVVPNDSIAEQFERQWLQAYPNARLLTAGSAELADDKKKGRNRRAEFVARVATGDWDAVILTKEAFQRIPLPEDAQEDFLRAELDALEAEKRSHIDVLGPSMTKRLESAMEAAEQRLKSRLADIERDVAGMTLADAGVDYLVVDEAQNYKNGMVNSAIPDLVIEGAHRSIDLDMKLSWLQKKHGSARVVLATATPWTGKFSEVYLWLRRLGHDLPRFDAWARTFVTSASFMEMTPGGTLRPKTRTRGTINEPELWRQIRLTSDVKMQADLRLPIPPMRGGKVEVVTVPASPEARVLTLDLARREKNLSGPPKPGEDNHLVIAHDGQLVATDLRTVGVQTNAPQKVDVLADDIHHEWSLARDNVYLRDDGTEHPVRGGLILVFCDESTPSNSWNFYHELRAQLVARGMAEDTIRFIHEAGSPQRRADLLAACREGAVSVLVGSTAKMGAGLNVQDRVIGGYEITPPWRPDISVQAIGRAGRQGNQNPEFFWKRLVLAPSLDAKKWEIASQKHTMFEPLYSSNEPARSRELATDDELGLADAMTAATGDPRYREKADLDRELKALKRQHSAYLRRQQALKLTISASRERIPKLEEKADRQDAVARRRVDTRGEQFRMTIRSTTYTSRTKAAEALVPLVEAAAKAVDRWSYEPEEVTLGQIGGFTLAARARSLPKPQILLYFADAPDSSTGVILDPDELPTGRGLITRIENQLDALATEGDRTREQIEEERRTITASHEALGQPFPGAARMEEVTRRRAELISQLSAGEEEAADPNEDPNSPEARARAARREARARELRELYDTARDLAQHQHGLSVRAAQTFASWYQTITSPVVADQRPPIDTALSVWTAIGRPDSGGRSRLRTLGAAEVQATTDEDVTHDPSQADTTADTAHRDADTPTVDPTPPPTTEPATRTTDAATAESPLSAILAASDRIQLHHIGPTTRENSTRTQEKRRATPANDMPDRAPTGEASQTPHSDDSPAPESTDAVDTTALTKAGLNDEVLTAAAPTVQPPEMSPADLPTENSAEAPEQAPERTVELPPEPTAMLRRFRELGGKQGLQVSVVRVAEAVFVTLHEPVTPQQPVLCWPAESTQAFDGAARPVALDAIEDYLQRYRSAVDPAWFTLDTRVRHWARRMAQLAPHVVPGARDDQQELAELVQQAVQHATSDERHAEDLLRRAERETTPLRLAPSREAQVVRTIHDLAPGYAPAGDVGRYLTDPAHLDGTWQEWEWINNYTREHPEVLSGTTALNRIRKRDADEAAEREKAATALVKQASTAFRARDFERALDLIDRAELLYPEGLARWDRARHRVMAKAEQLEDSSSEPTSAETPPTDEVSRSVVPAPEATAADAASEASVAEPKTAGEPMMPVLPADVQVALYAQINHEAARWFEAQLDSSPEAQRYLERRLGGADKVRRVRLTVNVTGGLCIGYAPDSWTGLVDHLRQQGFQEQDLVDAGVATVSSRGTLIDRFRGRIMFGIRNRRGLLAGFTGRALSDSASAKYLNSPASVLFDKSKLLFGLYEQAPVAPHADAIVAVEGPFDVAATLANTPQRCPIVVVAPCGTALTSGHLDAIDALVPRDRPRVFAFDADASGRKAVIERATDALGRYEELGLTTLPDGQDPAEYALSVGPEENAAAYLGPPHTRPAVEVLVEARLQRWGDRVQWVDGQVDAARDVATLLAVLNPDRVSDLVVRLAERLQVDATYLAEFIADARHAQGLPPDRPLPRPDRGDTAAPTAEVERDAAPDERPDESAAAEVAAPASRDDQPVGEQQDSADAAVSDEAKASPLPTTEHAAPSAAPDTGAHGDPNPNDMATPAPARPDSPGPEDAAAAPPQTSAAPQPAADDRTVTAAEPGPWTRRIGIEVTGSTALIRGTDKNDPPELRQALKTHGFRWRPQEGYVWKFQPSRTRLSRDEVVQAIRDVLASLDAREAAQAAPRAPSYPPTPQQQAIIDACLQGKNVAVRALAGTGKTSTMRMVAARMPDKKITYIAFNRSIADEAQSVFGRNVRADTMHAFARQALQSVPRYRRKLNSVARRDGFPEQVARELGLDPDVPVRYGPDAEPREVEAAQLVQLAQAAVKRYRESADRELGRRHLGQSSGDAALDALVLDYARRIWADKESSDGVLAFTHDDYLKMWALTDPEIPGDVIIFDEAQDVNELQARLVQAQRAQVIVVGDSYQSIYGFRGARDYLRDWPAEVVLPLTKSWRFGPAVADTGNLFLGLLKSPLQLEGNPALDTRLEAVPNPDAVLCRTNAGAVAAVLTGREDGKRVALVGGGTEIVKLARAAKALQDGRRTNHEDLRMFASWREVRDYVNEHDEAQSLRTVVRLIDQHTPDGLIAMADELVDEDANPDLVVSTAHKAKGREWHNVRIADDFPQPTLDPDTGKTILPAPEELRLAYVTVTRAQRRLELGSLQWITDYSQPSHQSTAPPLEQDRSREHTADTEPVSADREASPAPTTAPTEATSSRQDTHAQPTPPEVGVPQRSDQPDSEPAPSTSDGSSDPATRGADGAANEHEDSSARPETPAATELPPPEPLTSDDYTTTLRLLSADEVVHLVRRLGLRDPGSPSSPGTARGGSLPDAPATTYFMRYLATGLQMTFSSGESHREGRLSWKRLQSWIDAGLSAGIQRRLLAADTAANRFTSARSGFAMIGEAELASAAYKELDGYRRAAVAEAIDRATKFAQTNRGRPPRRRTASTNSTDALLPDEQLDISSDDQAVLDRIHALTSVLPAEVIDHRKATDLVVGDVVEHPGFGFAAFRLTQPPVRHRDHYDLAGELLDGYEPRTLTWPCYFDPETTDAPLVRVVVRPESLTSLMSSAAAPTGPAAADEEVSEVDAFEVGDEFDVAAWGWSRIELTYGEHGPVERWSRDGTTLVLRWRDQGDDLLLEPTVTVDGVDHHLRSEDQLHQLLRETDRSGDRQDAERTAATRHAAPHGTDRAAQAGEPSSMGAPVSASPAGEQGSLFSSFEVMSSAADAVASRPAAPRTDQDETTTSGTSTTDDQDQVPEQTDDRAPQSAPIAPPSTGMPATPAAPTDGVELSASGRRAVAAIEFVPAATRAWPVPEQLADMSIPGPVREYEPARLAFVHTQRAVREPGMSPAHRATIIVNLAGGQTSEAVEVAQHLQALAALIDASGQSDRLADGSSLAQYLRDTSDAITRRLAGTPEAASVVPPTPALSSPVEAVRPGDDAAAALPVDGPDSPTPTPLVANVSFQDSATAVASASREAPDHGPDDALDEEDAEPLSGLAEEEMGSSPQRADELAELADLWADVADSDSVEPTPATPPQTLDAAADTTAEAEAVSARSEAVSAATPPTDSTADSAPSETTVSEERLAEQWATLVERAADLGYAVQTRYATSSTRLPESQPTVFVDAELPAHERLVDLALQVVEIATTQARVQTTPQPPLPGPRQTEQPLFARHTGHLDVTLAEPDGPTRGQLSGTLDLPCDEKLWPRVSGQLPLHEHAAATVVRPPAHTLAGHADAAAARLPGSPPSRRYTATFGEQPRPGATRT